MAKPKQTTKEEIISSLPTLKDNELMDVEKALKEEKERRVTTATVRLNTLNN
jgi:hypothetical protein